jgi:glycosyltransferase involved in cell wall biosynthesis
VTRQIALVGGAGYTWRIGWPAEYLKAQGWDVLATTRYPPADTVRAVIIHQPIARASLYWVRVYRRAGVPVVVQDDDDIRRIPKRNSFQATPDMIRRHDRAIAEADGLIVSTPRLLEVYGPRARRVWMVRNAIAPWVRKMKAARVKPPAVRIGWMGVIDVHRQDLEWARPGISQLPAGRLSVVGDRRAGRLLGWRGPSESWDWVRDPRRLYRLMDRADIGMVPLDLGEDRPFNEAKSYIKALEYMTLGKPVVVADLPEQRLLIRNGTDGFLVDNPMDFADSVRQLIEDAQLRATMGQNARTRAAEFTTAVLGAAWEQVLTDLGMGKDEVGSEAKAPEAEAAGRKSRKAPHSGVRRPSARRSAKAPLG